MSNNCGVEPARVREILRLAARGHPTKGLLIGKGPSFEQIASSSIDLADFVTVGLNHVVSRLPIDVASIIDLDVVADCADDIYRNAKILAIPYHPHVDFDASKSNVFEFFDQHEVLGKMAGEGRLLVYNASTARKLPRLKNAPDFEIRFFSSEAGYELLNLIGVEEIFTAGVDGGQEYAHGFDARTRLANGRDTFGYQFLSLNSKFARCGIRFGPLNSQSPIRVFVGCDETQYLASRVLEYSLYMHSETAIELRRIDNTGLRKPNSPEKQARTPFSFARFDIPRLCGYRGRAIYVDADMIVFANIREVWESDFGPHQLLYSLWGRDRRPQYSVMLLDCEKLQWQPDEIIDRLDREDVTYDDVMYHFDFMDREALGPRLPEAWNSLEVYEPGKTKLLHYTDMDRQPWVTNVNENAFLFYDLLKSAIQEGFIGRKEFEAEVRKGHVSPLLADWIGVERPSGAPKPETWVPPYEKSQTKKGRPAGVRKVLKKFKKWL